MKYVAPAVSRRQVVGQMSTTQSECEAHGGYWYPGKGCGPKPA